MRRATNANRRMNRKLELRPPCRPCPRTSTQCRWAEVPSSVVAKRHAAPGAPTTRRARHPTVERPAGNPRSHRKLIDEQVEQSYTRDLAAALTLHREGPPVHQGV